MQRAARGEAEPYIASGDELREGRTESDVDDNVKAVAEAEQRLKDRKPEQPHSDSPAEPKPAFEVD